MEKTAKDRLILLIKGALHFIYIILIACVEDQFQYLRMHLIKKDAGLLRADIYQFNPVVYATGTLMFLICVYLLFQYVIRKDLLALREYGVITKILYGVEAGIGILGILLAPVFLVLAVRPWLDEEIKPVTLNNISDIGRSVYVLLCLIVVILQNRTRKCAEKGEEPRQRNILKGLVIAAFSFMLAAIPAEMLIIPQYRYNSAVKKMENGEYEEALALLKKLEQQKFFKDTRERIRECHSRIQENDRQAEMEKKPAEDADE